jgi:hypothetical protein
MGGGTSGQAREVWIKREKLQVERLKKVAKMMEHMKKKKAAAALSPRKRGQAPFSSPFSFFGKKGTVPFLLSFSITFLCLFLISCGGKSDEDLIMELMGKIGSLAEKKDVNGVMSYLTEDYGDFEGRDLIQTEDMIRGYFKQFKGIAVNVLSTRIDEIRTPEATIETDVALSSGAAKVFRKLIRLSTDNYRLKIKLKKVNNVWRIHYAEWRYISYEELFPESISIFKKIFKM